MTVEQSNNWQSPPSCTKELRREADRAEARLTAEEREELNRLNRIRQEEERKALREAQPEKTREARNARARYLRTPEGRAEMAIKRAAREEKKAKEAAERLGSIP